MAAAVTVCESTDNETQTDSRGHALRVDFSETLPLSQV